MPFDLRNAAETFKRFMDHAVRGLDFVYVYIDDILVASSNPVEHTHHLRTLFQRFLLLVCLSTPLNVFLVLQHSSF